MNKLLKMSLVASLFCGVLFAHEDPSIVTSVRNTLDSFGQTDTKEISIVDKFRKMFTDGKVTGQIRSMYAGYDYKKDASTDTYATALGGQLKFELASFNGFSGAFAFSTSQDIEWATGETTLSKQNSELSSSAGAYTQLSEAYLNYKNGSLNIRAGRQQLDTPLADSDDIRMILNTFEAYMATYEVSDMTLTLGNVQAWQGTDADLDNGWVRTGDRGTSIAGLSYSAGVDVELWYYDISKAENASKAVYGEVAKHFKLSETSHIHAGVQYLQESEDNNSGVEASIYGLNIEWATENLSVSLAYNASAKKVGKHSFSGIGGGTMYTSMDTMIIDEITEDREAEATVASLGYTMGYWNFIYAYGDFNGKADSSGNKAHIIEQDIGFEYNVNDAFVLAAIYVMEEDAESSIATDNDWDRFQVMAKYDF